MPAGVLLLLEQVGAGHKNKAPAVSDRGLSDA